MYIIIVNMDITIVIVSVADPDPVGSFFFGLPESGKIPDPDLDTLYIKDPCI